MASDGASRHHTFSFESLRDFAARSLIDSAKQVIIHYLGNFSLDHAHSTLERFRHFIEFVANDRAVESIRGQDILSYRSTLDRDHEWYFGVLRPFFYRWERLRLPGIGVDAISTARSLRLKGNRKGDAVRSRDPRRGQFTDIELQAIIGALNDAFASKTIDIENYILIWLFLAFGARSVQLALLKLIDFSAVTSKDGTAAYILQVPRVKQPEQAPRTQFKARKVVPEIGRLIEGYCAAALGRWQATGLGPREAAPFFVNTDNADAIPALRYHFTSDELQFRIQAVFCQLNVVSERTGKPLHVTTRRFRYTVGTRAAAEGASELVIAELLDHSDTTNVGVYVESVPEIAERIDRNIAAQLAPMAQAFHGVLVTCESDAIRGDDPRSRIASPIDLTHPVGSCGSYGFCGAAAPVGCYICRNFQPWLDGPHEQVLDQLIAERDRILRDTGDARIAAVNDRVILACAEVVRLCAARKASVASAA